MGLLVNGVWQDQWYDTKKSGGKFIRTEAQFRHFIDFDSEFHSGQWSVSPLCFFSLPLGSPHTYLSKFEGFRRSYFCQCS